MQQRNNASITDLQKVQLGLEALRSLDLKSVTIDKVFEQLSKISIGYSTTTVLANAVRLYRCRRNGDNGRFLRLEQLMAPKPSDVTKLGRVNAIGESIFYGSPDRQVSLQEMRPIEGEIITMLMLDGKKAGERFELMHAGIDEVGRRLGDPEKWIAFGQPLLGDRYQDYANNLIKSYHTDEFLRHVPRGEEHLYKPTIAIGQKMLKHEQSIGIMYPSFALDFKGVNYALKPNKVLQYYKPSFVLEMLVSGRVPNGEFVIEPLAFATKFNGDGTIDWFPKPPTRKEVWPILGTNPVSKTI